MNPSVSLERLRTAIDQRELILFFQPKVNLLSGEVVGAEALVRWQLPDGSVLTPDAFLPDAAALGLSHEITLSMLNESVLAIQQLKQVAPDLSLSMNVTPQDLETQSVSRSVSQYLEGGALQSNDLQIEITESTVMGNFDRIYKDVIELTRMGIRVLMDDFGTGYSSIDRLSQLPFSALKLDQGVVRRMGQSRHSLDVVKSSISMARELRMISVAEGVESEGAYNFLVANGCEEVQGYWISHPLKLADLIDFLRQEHRFEGSQLGRIHQALFNVLHYRKSLIDAAYCYRLSADTILDSVVDPEVELSAAESRFGLWYYGIGQRLDGMAGFAALEQPFLTLHHCGQQFMEVLRAGADAAQLHQIIAQTDTSMNELSASLRRLELELLLGHR
ncbi:MAG: EAL domain-containing protein [Gammaproteobacteria bacterium]|nr:EAL domain-containing protein [Gammaproteobacteria bacterium]